MKASAHPRGAFRIVTAVLLLVVLYPLASRTNERYTLTVAEGLRRCEHLGLHLKASVAQGNQGASAPGKTATLAEFAWLEGHWHGEWGPRTAEQIWTAPKAGLMLGTFRLVEDNKTLLIEVYTLLQKPDGIEFRFRHFTPDLAPWEKSDATLLTLESFNGTRFVFANSANGEPKRAVFTRLNQDTYMSRFELLPASGEMQVVEITYHRQKLPRS